MSSSTPVYPAPRDPATPVGTVYTEQRAHDPVSKVTLPSGHEAWLVSRYADVRAVLADPRASRYLLYPGAPYMIEPGDFSTGERSILNLDPPDHTRVRKLVAKAFTPRRMAHLRGRIEEITSGLLDSMAALKPPADLIEEFAFPLPTAVICELLGVPFEDRERFRAWSAVIVTPMQHAPEQVAAAQREGTDDMLRLIASKRESPGDDLLSALIQARDEGDRLTEQELGDLATQILLAGHETTVSLIGTGVVLLMRHPDQLAAVRADPALIAPAVEEILRYESPADTSLLRVAAEDITIAGVTIRKGEAIIAVTGSGNFDERAFTRPEAFDVSRTHNPHLGFGHGAHFCLGAPLARVEGQVALAGLLSRFPALRLAVPPEEIVWRPPLSVRGPVAVPV
ncbi:MAG: cytochrome P450, partial [Streptosporangiales bacterium]|nr:cytochrome P450 [Streptosporangiales bacterium]